MPWSFLLASQTPDEPNTLGSAQGIDANSLGGNESAGTEE